MTQRTSPPLPAPSPFPFEINRLRRHLSRVLCKKASIRHVEDITGGNIFPTYFLFLSDSSQYILKLPPATTTRLLRHEQRGLEAELLLHQQLAASTDVPVSHVLSHDLTYRTLGIPFILLNFLPGRRLSDHQHYLSEPDRQSINSQLGIFIAAINQVTTTRFGQLPAVASGSGCWQWRDGFVELMENALRDAEDMVIALPYQGLRRSLDVWGEVLEEVRESKLVLLEVGEIIINETSSRIEGLVGCGRAIWGDPLMAGVLDHADEAFLTGYGAYPPAFGKERIRQLLYSAYRAVVQIVENYYRPGDEEKELDARRRLTDSLNALEAIEASAAPT
ncbi:MAG: hypothetical protein M4579_003382 [Chaenotheca gracillima]|nr:MAG: hypothetical protein M4579_003382 [Chaenotheca gracillima]